MSMRWKMSSSSDRNDASELRAGY